jgi:SAM-dependent methyltransferase
VKPLWFPTSALLDAELDCWASPVMLRFPLAAGGPVTVRYVGDRMWPAFVHGELIEVSPADDPPGRGDVVVVDIDGRVELWRVAANDADHLHLVADADPEPPFEVPSSGLIGVVVGHRLKPPSPTRRALRRARLDLAESWRGGPGQVGAASVLEKYDSQAEGYAAHALEPTTPDWNAAIGRHLGSTGRVVVVGCGAGKECFALERAGFEVHGVDFSTKMVRLAERIAAEAGVGGAVFHVADANGFDPPDGRVDGVLFTPDVYSFVPTRIERLALLRRISGWLATDAPLLLSARTVSRVWPRAVLASQWLLAGGRRRPGDSHTRYFLPDGSEHRSFVHCFSPRTLELEIRLAGYRRVARERSFHVLRLVQKAPTR